MNVKMGSPDTTSTSYIALLFWWIGLNTIEWLFVDTKLLSTLKRTVFPNKKNLVLIQTIQNVARSKQHCSNWLILTLRDLNIETSREKYKEKPDARHQMMNIGFSFTAFLVIIFAYQSIVGPINGKNLSSQNYTGKGIVVEGNKNIVNLGHDKEIKTALSQIQKSLASLEEKISEIHPNRCGK